ncbi:MAG: hypothetical protein BGO78_12960 [Chloroflexi bacterium 44-23]|nr:MAG: hypothetical protein BGO78_12960 [Chloroflexi bacterium 44-23]
MAFRAAPPSTDIRAASEQGIGGQVVLFTAARTLINTAYRMVYPFLSVFARGLGVDLLTISLVMTARSAMGFLGPFLAPIADLRGRKISMLLGLSMVVVSSILITLFPIYPVFFAGLLGIALGNLVFIPAMQAYVSDLVPYERRGRVIGVTELNWSLAFIIGVPLVGWLINALTQNAATSEFAWRAPFPFIAAFGLFFMILIAIRIPNNRSQSAALGSGIQTIQLILRNPVVLAGLGFALATSAANETVNLIFGVWLEDQYGLKLAALGAASAVIGISELSGEGLSAYLTDRWGKENSIKAGLFISITATVLLYFVSSSGVPAALVGLFLFYLGFEFTIVSSLPLMSEVFPPARATVMASVVACFSIGRAVGALLAPRLYRHDFLWNLGFALLFNAIAFILLRRLERRKDAG